MTGNTCSAQPAQEVGMHIVFNATNCFSPVEKALFCKGSWEGAMSKGLRLSLRLGYLLLISPKWL